MSRRIANLLLVCFYWTINAVRHDLQYFCCVGLSCSIGCVSTYWKQYMHRTFSVPRNQEPLCSVVPRVYI